MMNFITGRKTAQKLALPPAPPSAPPPAKESAGLRLASAYREKRPSPTKVKEFKHQIAWDSLDDEGRYRVQQLLNNLVPRVPGSKVLFPYRESITADFIVSRDVLARLQEDDRRAAAAEGLAKDLDLAKNRLLLAEQRADAERSQLRELQNKYEQLQQTCHDEATRADDLYTKFELLRSTTAQLCASLPPARSSLHLQTPASNSRKRYSLPVVPAAPYALSEEQTVDDDHVILARD